MILLNGFIQAISSAFKNTTIQEIHLVNNDPTVTDALLKKLKSSAFQNDYHYIGQTLIYLVKQGEKPFAPAKKTGIIQDPSGTGTDVAQAMDVDTPARDFTFLPKPLTPEQGMPLRQSSGLNPPV